MRGVMLEVPSHLLDERARTDAGRFDEMWEGVLHMVPPPDMEHQRMEGRLYEVLLVPAREAGLRMVFEAGLYDPQTVDASSYRQPDLMLFAPSVVSRRGVEGAAALVIEIRSPGDESFEKLPFYERVGVAEYLIIDRDDKAVRRWRRDRGRLVEVAVEAGGEVALDAVAVTLRTVDGQLEARTAAGRSVI